MIEISLKQAAEWMEGTLIHANQNIMIYGVSRDSREINNGNLYIALEGERWDGHDFLEDAFQKGASGAVVNRIPQTLKRNYPLILVKDTVKALGRLAQNYRKQFSLPVVALTGSNGKTTTKELLAHILSRKEKVLKTKGNWNNHIGVPLNLLALSKEHRYAVLEMGANHSGEIDYLSSLIEPDLGILTSIGEAHLEGFGSIEGVKKAKGELIPHLKGKTLIINGEDPHLLEMAQKHKGRLVTYGFQSHLDFQGRIIQTTPQGSWIQIFNESFFLPLLGRYNALNALGAISTALELGLSLKDCLDWSDFSPPSFRMEKREFQGATFFLDCYNANPTSLQKAIETIKSLEGRKILVLGSLLELGSHSERLHKELGEWAFYHGIELALVLGNEGYPFYHAFQKAGGKGWFGICPRLASKTLLSWLKPGDIVLFKGSRGAALERIWEALLSTKAA